MKLQKLREFAAFGSVALAVDEAFNPGGLVGLQHAQPTTLNLRAATLEEFEEKRNIVFHSYWRRCGFRNLLQKKCVFGRKYLENENGAQERARE